MRHRHILGECPRCGLPVYRGQDYVAFGKKYHHAACAPDLIKKFEKAGYAQRSLKQP